MAYEFMAKSIDADSDSDLGSISGDERDLEDLEVDEFDSEDMESDDDGGLRWKERMRENAAKMHARKRAYQPADLARLMEKRGLDTKDESGHGI